MNAAPSNLTIREATADDFPALRALYRDVWGYSRPEKFDRWRYLNVPDGPCPIAVVVDGQNLAGAYTLWPVRLRIGRATVLGAQSMDTMTHPAYQGRGLFVKLALHCFDIAAARGFEVLYGFPNPLSFPGFVRRLNWDHTGDVAHWIRPITPSRHPKVPPWLGPAADGVCSLLPRGSRGILEIVNDRPSEKDIESLTADWHGKMTGCAVQRDSRWFEWRYAPDAANSYRFVSVYKAGVLKAMAVWGMRDASWGTVADGRAHLTELLGFDGGALSAALSETIAQATRAGAMLIETITNATHLVPLLRRAAFISHRRAPLIVRGLSAHNRDANIHDHATWHISGGDVDTF